MSDTMEKSRISCFERTGCLITMLVTKEHDARIKPQGLPQGSFCVPDERKPVTNENKEDGTVIPHPKSPEEAALEEEEKIIKEQEDSELFLDNDDDDDKGEEIDDNPEDI